MLHTGVGAINETDVVLASTANAIIVGFNVRPNDAAAAAAKRTAADLKDCGADTVGLNRMLFEIKSRARFRLEAI